MGILDNIANVDTFDPATPLAHAAALQNQQLAQHAEQFKQKQTELGSEIRGLQPYVNTPDFAGKWAETSDRLLQNGVIDPQTHAKWRNAPSPLLMKSIISQTEDPTLSFRKEEAQRTQANTDRDFGATQDYRNKSLALQARGQDRLEDKTPAGFEADPAGGYHPIKGGPADPSYISQVTGARAGDSAPEGYRRTEAGMQPIPGGPADPATVKALTEAKTGPGSVFDDETIGEMAKQARAGDTSVFTNIGRGAQGPENLARLRKEIVRQNKDEGVSGQEQALRNAEFFGVKAGQRTIGTKGANIEMAATEFNQVLPVVQEASKAVSRTNYPDLNKIIIAAESKTGDPNVVKFGGGVNTLVNLYARAISPSGNPTVSDKEHAREILSAAWSQGQFVAAVGMMSQEIKAALSSPEKVRDEMRTRFLKGQGAAPVGYPAPGGEGAAKSDPLGIR